MSSPKSDSRRFEKIKFFYVDDERDNLDTFKMMFDREFEIVTFENPLEALEAVKREEDLGVLLVDQVMPLMTGIELATEAKKIRPTLACVMITGNATKQLAIESIRQRVFYEFLEKPVKFESGEIRQLLVNAVQEHLLQKVKFEYHSGTVELLAQLIDDKDGHTHRHSARVMEWSVKIGRKFKLSEKELVLLREGALLHDIGKISIPDDILKKPGKLSPLERKIIQTHAPRGGDVLERVPQLRELAPIARYHHERPDGKGYPLGLTGEQIPLLAAIVAVADFYEALSAKRPYKDPWSVPDIVAEILKMRGAQFPAAVVDAMIEILQEEGVMEREAAASLRTSAAA